VGTGSVRPFKANFLTLCTVIPLLAIIVVVLILPDVDLPDTAFQRNGTLQALRTLSHQIPHASAKTGSFHVSFHFENASIPPRQTHETCARHSNDLPIQHKALRC